MKKDISLRLSHDKAYKGIERTPEKQIDMLIVVNQMLTGFDSKWINVLYLDKLMKQENIIQAFSRTNRIFGSDKPVGLIYYYRYPHTMKRNIEDAVKMYSGDKAYMVFVDKLEKNLEVFNALYLEIKELFENENIDDFSHLPTVDKVNCFYVGMVIDIYAYDDVVEEGLKVTAVDAENSTITLDAAADNANISFTIYLNGAYGKELTGLRSIFNDTNLYGVTKDGESYMKPAEFVLTSSLTEDILMEKINFLEEFYNNRPNMILCSFATKRTIAALLTENRRQLDMTTLQGGYSAILFDGIPVVADRFCPNDAIYLVNTDDFGIYQLCDWEWLEDEDGKILKQVPGKAAYSATLVKYAELICTKPCAQGIITGF